MNAVIIFLVLLAGHGKPCKIHCHSVDLAWTASETPEVIGYSVYRNGLIVAQGAGLSVTDPSVQSGQSYTYYVTAYDVYTESSPSNSVTVTVPR